MARIPLGDFAQARAIPQADRTQVDTSPLNVHGRGGEALARGLMDVAEVVRQQGVQDRQEAEAVARAKAANAATAYEIEVQAAVADEADNLRRGGDYTTASERLTERLGKLQAPRADGLSPEAQVTFDGAIENARKRAGLSIQGAVVAARRDDGQRQIAKAIDLAGKVAALPGADVAQVNAQLRERAGAMADLFGVDRSTVENAVRTRVDANWANHADQRFNAGAEDVATLQALRTDLTADDGYYLDKLDPEKRLALTAAVDFRIHALQAAAKVEVDKRERIAEGVVKDAVAQAVSGLPPKPETLATWQVAVQGTSFEPAFQDAVRQIVEVQQVRRLPGPEQQKWLAEHETALNRDGGSPQDLQRLKTVRAALQHDAQERKENPLQYLENMTGKPAATLTLDGLATGDVGAIGTALADRMASLQALRSQGYDVALKPLKAEEVQALANGLAAMPPERALALFAPLRAATGSDETYRAVMEQLAPGMPLKAYAGELAVRPGGQKAAELVLRGEALLAGKGGQKWTMPGDANFNKEFMAAVGNAYQGRPDALRRDLDAARAVYAASAAQDGATQDGTEFNPVRFRNSIRAVAGEVAEINGTQVLPPWGVPADTFADQVEQPMREALQAAGLDPDASGVGLMSSNRPGRYVLVQGRSPIWNPAVKRPDGRPVPVFFDFTPPPPAPKETHPATTNFRAAKGF